MSTDRRRSPRDRAPRPSPRSRRLAGRAGNRARDQPRRHGRRDDVLVSGRRRARVPPHARRRRARASFAARRVTAGRCLDGERHSSPVSNSWTRTRPRAVRWSGTSLTGLGESGELEIWGIEIWDLRSIPALVQFPNFPLEHRENQIRQPARNQSEKMRRGPAVADAAGREVRRDERRDADEHRGERAPAAAPRQEEAAENRREERHDHAANRRSSAR